MNQFEVTVTITLQVPLGRPAGSPLEVLGVIVEGPGRYRGQVRHALKAFERALREEAPAKDGSHV